MPSQKGVAVKPLAYAMPTDRQNFATPQEFAQTPPPVNPVDFSLGQGGPEVTQRFQPAMMFGKPSAVRMDNKYALNPLDYMSAEDMAIEKGGLAQLQMANPNARYAGQLEQMIAGSGQSNPHFSAGAQLGAVLSPMLGGADPFGAIPEVAQQMQGATRRNAVGELSYKRDEAARQQRQLALALQSQGMSESMADATALSLKIPELVGVDNLAGSNTQQLEDNAVFRDATVKATAAQNQLKFYQDERKFLADQAQDDTTNQIKLLTLAGTQEERNRKAMVEEANRKGVGLRIAENPETMADPVTLGSMMTQIGADIDAAKTLDEKLLIGRHHFDVLRGHVGRLGAKEDTASLVPSLLRLLTEAEKNNPVWQKVLEQDAQDRANNAKPNRVLNFPDAAVDPLKGVLNLFMTPKEITDSKNQWNKSFKGKFNLPTDSPNPVKSIRNRINTPN